VRIFKYILLQLFNALEIEGKTWAANKNLENPTVQEQKDDENILVIVKK